MRRHPHLERLRARNLGPNQIDRETECPSAPDPAPPPGPGSPAIEVHVHLAAALAHTMGAQFGTPVRHRYPRSPREMLVRSPTDDDQRSTVSQNIGKLGTRTGPQRGGGRLVVGTASRRHQGNSDDCGDDQAFHRIPTPLA